jgi:hypothetical protein
MGTPQLLSSAASDASRITRIMMRRHRAHRILAIFIRAWGLASASGPVRMARHRARQARRNRPAQATSASSEAPIQASRCST